MNQEVLVKFGRPWGYHPNFTFSKQQKSNYLFAAGFFNFTIDNSAKADE